MIPPFGQSAANQSMQVHLHHTAGGAAAAAGTNAAVTSSVAISWATAASLGDCATVRWGVTSPNEAATKGVSRTYPTAVLADGTKASFNHVVLAGLVPGQTYKFSVGCDATADAGAQPPRSFSAPRTVGDAPYSFAIFGDMGISQAAHDTVQSMAAQKDELEFVVHIGDISYARGNEAIWNVLMASAF